MGCLMMVLTVILWRWIIVWRNRTGDPKLEPVCWREKI